MTETEVPRAWIEGGECHVPDLAVHELFLSQAQRDPDAIAVQQWHKRLTYQQLASQAGALAQRLVAAGAGAGTRVGICLRRIPSLPASELAVLMAGSTFVPLDPDQPEQRLRAIVEDAGIETALADSAGAERLAGVVSHVIAADQDPAPGQAGLPRGQAGLRAALTGLPDQAAYIMYTSGSTGRPKGVMVSHRNLAHFVAAANQALGGAGGYRQAAFAAIGFDVCVYEFFTPLACGGSIQLVSESERADAEQLQRFLETHRTTRVFLPPVILPLLDPDRLPGLSELIVGGEACDPGQVGRWAVPGLRRFINWYGPTETTVAVLGTELDGDWDQPLPLGRPLPGSRVYILDQEQDPCPPGTAGELYIGGAQVSLGYVHAPDAPGRFIPDPFGSPARERGGRGLLYRTGDLARWDETGVVSFLGRADRQVKIHGRRVEPGEIEAVLTRHPRVLQAVVDVAESTIRAYVTPADAPASDELRAHCAEWLPAHMVPASVWALAKIPLTVNAKVDYPALRRIGPAGVTGPDTAAGPQTRFGREVARAWASVFETEAPGSGDDFFLLGGDSLVAMRLASALRRTTGRQVTPYDIFVGRTVSGIAARVGAAVAATGAQLPTGSAPALSSAQRRLWFVEQLAPGAPMHNVVLSERLTGVLDAEALARAFEYVSTWQTALRWRLQPGDGWPAVTVAEPAPVAIPVTDLSGLAAEARQAAVGRLLAEETQRPVGLTGGPLWRVSLARLDVAEHVLIMALHHIIFDGWSQAILYDELGRAYRKALAGEPASRPGPGEVVAADYTAWTIAQEARNGPTDTAWWQRHLAGAPTVLDLPRDRPRPAVLTFSGGRRHKPLDTALAAGISRLATAERSTISAVLLAAFAILLRRLSGEHDLIVGTPVADRGRAEFERLIGFLIRPLPLRLKVDDGATFGEHVQRCTDELAAAVRHADAPLERIIDAVVSGRDLARNPLFQVMFNVYNFAEARLTLGPAAGQPVQTAVPGSLVDLTLYVIVRDDGMGLEAVYNRDLYDAARIDALLDSYTELVRCLVADPGQQAGAVSIRPARSRLPSWQTPLTCELPSAPGLLEQVGAAGAEVPGQIAVTSDEQVLSYGDLLRVSRRIAAALGAAGLGDGGVAGVVAERSAVLPAVLLGVCASGARWVILDADLASGALDRQLAATGARAVIRCCRTGGARPDNAAALPVIDAMALVSDGGQAASAARPAGSGGYLSLTSGTTGEPKVIQTSQAPLAHFLNWYRAEFGFGRHDRFAMLSGVAHDPLLRDIFTPLSCGATLAVPDGSLLRDPVRLLDWLASGEITVAHLTPQLVRMLAAAHEHARGIPSLRIVAVAGDQLTVADAGMLRLIAPHARLLNFYGTTETPQAQAYHDVQPAGPPGDATGLAQARTMPVPVGAGIDGAQLIVMSVCGQPAAAGELGEVLIRSRHLADGYADPALTRQRFVSLPGTAPERAYRTGDVGRYGPSGAVTLAGRADDQVKVRGYRVELGEVEAALLSHPGVEAAAAVLFEHSGTSHLHAYVKAATPLLDASGLLQDVRSRLPSYAVPSGVTVLPALPCTGSGTVDRARLPPPRMPAHVRAAVGDVPAGRLERLVLAVWREVLGRPRVGRDENFFEIGGNSMAIIEVQARLRRGLGQAVPIVDLFRFPTVRTLAACLAGDQPDTELLAASVRGRLRRQRPRTRVTGRAEGGASR